MQDLADYVQQSWLPRDSLLHAWLCTLMSETVHVRGEGRFKSNLDAAFEMQAVKTAAFCLLIPVSKSLEHVIDAIMLAQLVLQLP